MGESIVEFEYQSDSSMKLRTSTVPVHGVGVTRVLITNHDLCANKRNTHAALPR